MQISHDIIVNAKEEYLKRIADLDRCEKENDYNGLVANLLCSIYGDERDIARKCNKIMFEKDGSFSYGPYNGYLAYCIDSKGKQYDNVVCFLAGQVDYDGCTKDEIIARGYSENDYSPAIELVTTFWSWGSIEFIMNSSSATATLTKALDKFIKEQKEKEPKW